MKFVFAFIALAAIASASAQSGTTQGAVSSGDDKATFSDTKFYTGKLDSAQGAIEDIGKANTRLAGKEEQLKTLVDDANFAKLMNAEKIMEEAVDKDAYQNSFLAADLKAE